MEVAASPPTQTGAASPPRSKSPQDTEITCKMRKSPLFFNVTGFHPKLG